MSSCPSSGFPRADRHHADAVPARGGARQRRRSGASPSLLPAIQTAGKTINSLPPARTSPGSPASDGAAHQRAGRGAEALDIDERRAQARCASRAKSPSSPRRRRTTRSYTSDVRGAAAAAETTADGRDGAAYTAVFDLPDWRFRRTSTDGIPTSCVAHLRALSCRLPEEALRTADELVHPASTAECVDGAVGRRMSGDAAAGHQTLAAGERLYSVTGADAAPTRRMDGSQARAICAGRFSRRA